MNAELEQLVDAHKRMQGRHDVALIEYRRARVAKNDADMDRWHRTQSRRLQVMFRLCDAMKQVIG